MVDREPQTYFDSFIVYFGYVPIYLSPASADRASVVAAIANLAQGNRADLHPSVNLQEVSHVVAAEMLNVSERSLIALAEHVRELSKALDTGKPGPKSGESS